jgi:hypothetical protein
LERPRIPSWAPILGADRGGNYQGREVALHYVYHDRVDRHCKDRDRSPCLGMVVRKAGNPSFDDQVQAVGADCRHMTKAFPRTSRTIAARN